MSHLLGMSFDSAASPSITLKAVPRGQGASAQNGWGFAWYPASESGAVVVKDPVPSGDTAMTSMLRDWERFRGTAFVCHVRGAAKRVTQEDTHPFSRSYGGRDWVLAHNGDLDPASVRELSLGSNPVFEPVGRTDSERAFCWLLTQIRGQGVRRLAGVGWTELHHWFGQLDELGTINLLMTDGQDLVAYRDATGFNSLWMTRRCPPHATHELENAIIHLDLSDPLDENRTGCIISTTPLSKEGWIEIKPGQMVVMRRGQVTWSSDPELASLVQPLSGELMTPDPVGPKSAMVDPLQSQSQSQSAARGAHPSILPEPLMVTGSDPDIIEREMTVVHETIYRYEEAVELSAHTLRLHPTHDLSQQVLSYDLEVVPATALASFDDVFGNRGTRFRLRNPYEELRIRATSRVLVSAEAKLRAPNGRMTLPLVWMPWQRQMMLPYLLPPELPETQLRELSEYAMSFAERQDFDLIETLVDINKTIYRDFKYLSGSTHLETTPFDVYTQRRGVCQDFANLFICLARLLNIAARYRVGYIYTGGNYENKVQSDASHAWVELYLPWLGWRGLDPTNGCLAGIDHVRVACGRNYRDATPTAGTIYKGGHGERLAVSVRVEPAGPLPQGALPKNTKLS